MVMKNWQITIRLAHFALAIVFFFDDDKGCTTDVIIPTENPKIPIKNIQ